MNNLTKNERLILKMTEWGYKRKNKNIFRKVESEAVLDFYFSHHSRREHHVIYYTINVNVWYPEIDRVKKDGNFFFGIPNSVVWNDLGHLMGAPVQKEYRIPDICYEKTKLLIMLITNLNFYERRNLKEGNCHS